jgi:hypothetical protein
MRSQGVLRLAMAPARGQDGNASVLGMMIMADHGKVLLGARVKIEEYGRPDVSGQFWRLGRV